MQITCARENHTHLKQEIGTEICTALLTVVKNGNKPKYRLEIEKLIVVNTYNRSENSELIEFYKTT